MSEANKPWWFPERVGPELVARLRKYYPDKTNSLHDEEVLARFDYGGRYATTWDHLGDAHDQFEPLADAFFDLLASCESFVGAYPMGINKDLDEAYRAARAAIQKAKGGA